MLKFARFASAMMVAMLDAVLYSKRETQSARASTVSDRTGAMGVGVVGDRSEQATSAANKSPSNARLTTHANFTNSANASATNAARRCGSFAFICEIRMLV